LQNGRELFHASLVYFINDVSKLGVLCIGVHVLWKKDTI